MSELTTIARPYAKAFFEHAVEAKSLALWSSILLNLSQAVLDEKGYSFITNPLSSPEQQTELLLTVLTGLDLKKEAEVVANTILLLAKNKRLATLPDISAQYEALRAEQEKEIKVQVHSFTALSQSQEEELIKSLSKRLSRKISLQLNVDESLLGGAIIRAGDLVIDGSVRGKLNKLGTELTA